MSTLGPLERSEMRNQIFLDRKTFKPIPAPPLFTVLRDMVPACPKYISGKLRSFSKNFSKNFFHTTLFENFLPNGVSAAAAKNQPAQWLGTPQNCPMTPKILENLASREKILVFLEKFRIFGLSCTISRNTVNRGGSTWV